MKQFLAIFNKVGGMEILRQYWRGHVLLFALVQTALLGFRKKSLEIVRLAVNNRILCKLRKKNRKFVAAYEAPELPRVRSKKVWICWMQGMEKAPELVQRCYASMQENLPDREIIALTEENYKNYVNFPEHICRKIESGVITRTHFSDLLRLELLLNHGGTWIDATVFCSGGQIPGYMLDSDLFMFQKLKPGLDGSATCISSWFMTSCTNHPILALTRDLLYRYWEKHNSMVDYFLIHDCFQLAIEKYPQLWQSVVPFPNSVPHILLLRLFEPYDGQLWDAVRNQTPFHKLTYKFGADQPGKPDTYYRRLIAGEGEK
jgi:hypothetical protein